MQKTISAALLILFCGDLRFAAAGYDEPMKFTYQSTAGGNCGDCEWVLAEGLIGPQTDQDFVRFLKTEAFADVRLTVQFNSPGGDLQAAIRLGHLLREKNWRTEVGYHYLPGTRPEEMDPERYLAHKDPKLRPSKCMSACVYAFLGGVQREVLDEAELGIHQFNDPRNSASTAQLLQGALAQYAVEMGVQPTLVYVAAASTPAQAPKLYVLSRSEMENWNVVTSYRRVAEWSVVTERSGLVALVHGTGKMKSSFAIFCRADGAPYLNYSWEPVGLGKAANAAELASDLGRTAFGFSVKAANGSQILTQKKLQDSVKAESGGRYSLTLSIRRIDVEALKGAGRIAVEWDVPRYLYGVAENDSFTMKKARDNIDVAMRNCIRG